eukprot:s5689_g1.t1
MTLVEAHCNGTWSTRGSISRVWALVWGHSATALDVHIVLQHFACDSILLHHVAARVETFVACKRMIKATGIIPAVWRSDMFALGLNLLHAGGRF